MAGFVQGLKEGQNPLIARIASIAALGGLLFGYDTGVISGALLYLKKDLHAGNLAQQAIVAVLLVGAIVGAGAAGFLADHAGRKKTMFAAGVIYVVGGIASAIAQNVGELIGARFILGLAVGTASFVGPMYISEVSPPRLRGGLVSFNQLAITVGIALSYAINYGFSGVPGNWRWMLGIAAVPGVMLTLGMLSVPDSPRWLFEHGREADARGVLARLRDGIKEVDRELDEIRKASAQTRGMMRLGALLHSNLRPLLTVGIGLAVFQQIVGINTVIYYAPTILSKTGLSAGGAIGQTIFVGVANVLFTIIAVLLLDNIGRRKFLIGGTIGLTVSLVALGLYFQLAAVQDRAPFLALVALVAYIASFAVGLGPVFWLMISEIFPMRARSAAMSASTMANWAANFAVSFTFLTLISTIGLPYTFYLYAGIGVLATLFFAVRVPETRHRTLEEIQTELIAIRAHPRATVGGRGGDDS